MANEAKKHTLGPWKVDPIFAVNITEQQGRYICTMNVSNVLGGSDIRAANAHLIAAAPDLLAACIEEMSLYEGMDTEEFSPGTAQRIKNMRAAIAKATGGEP